MIIENVVGIIGWPVSHSVSPQMHNRAFLELGLLNWSYVPMPVHDAPKSRVGEAVLGLRALGFRGANVTVPYKEMVLPYLDRLSADAQAIGAVNTIVVNANGLLEGHNTDGVGYINDLVNHGIGCKGLRAIMLGAGGSARAIAYGLLSHDVKRLMLLNRTKAKADEIASHFRPRFTDAQIDADSLTKESFTQALSSADIIINTTSIGLNNKDEELPFLADMSFSSSQIVYDIIYNPSTTALLTRAAACNARILNGLGMLVHQGALSFEIWTGRKAPINAMHEEAIKAIYEKRPHP